MKVWIKYLIGVALGIFAAFILPKEKTLEFITLLSDLFIRVGRYMVVPLIFTCGICSINKLRNSKLLLKS
ncbi:MAG: cation:dicarboxylase symporter family transporter, partial [Treponema sp.]|nr:cation:dicarboxylase symporter family transporter [Treponema sp.]